ncbi:MAG: response regulator transcription factor [Gemmatimonadota bacterium]
MATPRVLVVEDDHTTADLIALYLRHEGYRVDVAHTGDEARARIRGGRYDLLILDVMLPGVDGLDLCREVREEGETPIIFVTARTRERERIEGLDLGADDYVTKPFRPRELVARARAVLRRSSSAPTPSWVGVGTLRVDEGRRAVTFAGHTLDLTATEFRIVHDLVAHPGYVRSRDRLLRLLPDDGRNALSRTIDVHVRNIRKKLEAIETGAARWIETVSGEGYRIREPKSARDPGGVSP